MGRHHDVFIPAKQSDADPIASMAFFLDEAQERCLPYSERRRSKDCGQIQ